MLRSHFVHVHVALHIHQDRFITPLIWAERKLKLMAFFERKIFIVLSDAIFLLSLSFFLSSLSLSLTLSLSLIHIASLSLKYLISSVLIIQYLGYPTIIFSIKYIYIFFLIGWHQMAFIFIVHIHLTVLCIKDTEYITATIDVMKCISYKSMMPYIWLPSHHQSQCID